MSHRVYQWSSGTVGRYAAREVVRRQGMELTGLFVQTAGKTGRDVGDLLGLDAIGIAATDDVAAVCESSADLVIHAPLASVVYGEDADQDLKDICRLLAAGKNVITVVGYLYPKAHGPQVVQALENACAAGGSTFHSTGLNPGWMGDMLPLAMSALAGRIDQVIVKEVSNFQHYPSPEIMFDSMGFGADPATFEKRAERRRTWLNGLFRESIQLLADGIGMPLDDVVAEMEVAEAPSDLETASGLVKAGTVAGQHWLWRVVQGGETRIVHETVWRMHESVAPSWSRGPNSVTLEGEPRIHLDIAADWVSDGLLATAMHAVNAVPAVCAAPPGIRTLLDLEIRHA